LGATKNETLNSYLKSDKESVQALRMHHWDVMNTTKVEGDSTENLKKMSTHTFEDVFISKAYFHYQKLKNGKETKEIKKLLGNDKNVQDMVFGHYFLPILCEHYLQNKIVGINGETMNSNETIADSFSWKLSDDEAFQNVFEIFVEFFKKNYGYFLTENRLEPEKREALGILFDTFLDDQSFHKDKDGLYTISIRKPEVEYKKATLLIIKAFSKNMFENNKDALLSLKTVQILKQRLIGHIKTQQNNLLKVMASKLKLAAKNQGDFKTSQMTTDEKKLNR
jgi:hypothetical protein